MIAWLSVLLSLLPPLLMLLAIGTERLEATHLGAGMVREQDVKDFLDRVQRSRLGGGAISGAETARRERTSMRKQGRPADVPLVAWEGLNAG